MAKMAHSSPRRLSVLALVVACAGCATGIQVKHVVSNDTIPPGNPWNLGMTQFNITITRHVIACGAALTGTVEVIATPTMIIDDQQRYVLYSDGWWATSDITSNLNPIGVSTGLNAQTADQAATVITNLVGTVGQGLVAAAAFDVPARHAEQEPVAPRQVCSDDVVQALSKLYPPGQPKLQDVVDGETAALAQTTASVLTLTTQATLDKIYKPQLAAALQKQKTQQDQLTKDQDRLSKALKATTTTQTVSWPRTSIEFKHPGALQIDPTVLATWLKKDAAAVKTATAQFDVNLSIYEQSLVANDATSVGDWSVAQKRTFNATDKGVPVRLARMGRLLACAKKECPAKLGPETYADADNTQFDQVILQIGPMYTVPLTGGSFKAETAVVALDANGLPTSIEVSEKQAAAAVLTGAAQSAASSVAALPAQISAAKLASVQGAGNIANAQAALITAQANLGVAGQTAPLVAQTALVNAQSALEAAKTNAGLPTNLTTGLTAQAALINAQTALLTAQANASVASPTSALAAQTSLINAQTAQINATTALAKANASVGP